MCGGRRQQKRPRRAPAPSQPRSPGGRRSWTRGKPQNNGPARRRTTPPPTAKRCETSLSLCCRSVQLSGRFAPVVAKRCNKAEDTAVQRRCACPIISLMMRPNGILLWRHCVAISDNTLCQACTWHDGLHLTYAWAITVMSQCLFLIGRRGARGRFLGRPEQPHPRGARGRRRPRRRRPAAARRRQQGDRQAGGAEADGRGGHRRGAGTQAAEAGRGAGPRHGGGAEGEEG